MVKVKICGIKSEEDLHTAVEAGVDAVGFVVDVPRSARNLPLKQAKKLMDQVPRNTDSVAVTAFSSLKRVSEICWELRPSFIQLHGITSRSLNENRLPYGTRTIVAVDATAPHALEQAESHSAFADALLVDTSEGEGLGGTGRVHNWNLSRRIRDAIQPVPVILAGGLTPENVGHAIRIVKPYGVDVSTGVESKPGIKNPIRVAEFVRKCKEATV